MASANAGKNNTDFVPSRRQKAILDRVGENGFVATEALVEAFGVTPQTIRRDLNELHGEGLLARFHGGAGQIKSGENAPYPDRLQAGRKAKRAIAAATAALVPNGASLFLNIGTTTEAVAEALLGHENLNVVTNNINVARILCRNESFRVIIAGGQVRNQDGGIVGLASADFIGQFRMDLGIIGISGIAENGDLLDFDLEEVRTARAIVENSQTVILVADRHKFGRRAMNRLGSLSELDRLVTDGPVPAGFKPAILQSGIELVETEHLGSEWRI